MQVAVVIDNPQGSQDLYDQVRATLGLHEPAGGIAHLAGPSPNGGWRVIEVFESEEQARAFLAERLGPAFRDAGASDPPVPEFWSIHTVLTA